MTDIQSEVNPFEAPRGAPSENGANARRSAARKLSLVTLYALAAVGGVALVFPYENEAIDWLISILLALAATNWAIVDARILGCSFDGILRLIYFVLWPLASLIYLMATRKLRGLAWWALNVVGLLATVAFTSFSTYYLLYSLGRTDLIDPELLY